MSKVGSRPPGQLRLLEAVRLTGNKNMGDIIKDSTIDDLEWFLMITEHQLEETPHWVKDERQLHEIQAWNRQAKILAAEILLSKKAVARKWIWLRQNGERLLWMVVGAAVSLFVRALLS